MYIVVLHTPSEDINCPGISVGPVALSPESAILAWKEASLPQSDPEDPHPYEAFLNRIEAALLRQIDHQAMVATFATDGEEQVYVLKVPALPEMLAAEGKRVSRIGNHRGTRFYVHQRVAHVPVPARAEDDTGEIFLGDYDTEEDALASHPGALVTYR